MKPIQLLFILGLMANSCAFMIQVSGNSVSQKKPLSASIKEREFKDRNIKYRPFGPKHTSNKKKKKGLAQVMSQFFSINHGKKKTKSKDPEGFNKLPIETLKNEINDSLEREGTLDERGNWIGGPQHP